MSHNIDLSAISAAQPVVIAGPTASGKSALALHIAETTGGVIINADALQVFAGWQVLTARPSAAELARAPHQLYGHVPVEATYSVGQWLRDIGPLLTGPQRPIIVGGTGLYFTALTAGLAPIPPTPPDIRTEADRLTLPALLADLDSLTKDRIDCANRARVQRAWEVLRTTGRGLAVWQDDTPPPLLPRADCAAFVLDAPPSWLTPRIEARFDIMLQTGALEEARAMALNFSPNHQSSKAIGAAELVAHISGETSLDAVRARVAVLTRQYAKRQRTWFRARMKDWQIIPAG
ncbi:MAG: tRNA (adenosine(37)-N6)-dimethylallyltransferase MiaA [Rhodobacteraceae bacterium]|nr:tRNA (adenosine(37)-N6)-dimethylallyltransferase MiaA [Paracoccaceae bacterium]